MADDLIAKLGELLKKKPWYQLPRSAGRCAPVSRCATSCARRTSTTRRSRRSRGRRSRPNLDPALRAGTNDRRHLQRSATFRRWDRPAAASAATSRWSTGRSRHAEPADSESARGQPRADDARTVPAGDDPQPAGGVVDPVHGARLVRARALEDRASSRSRRRRRRLRRSRASACRARCRIRRPPGRRGRPPTPI